MINNITSGIGYLSSKSISIQNALIKYKNDSIRIVYYHMITDKNHDYYFQEKAITVNDFREQIKFFKKHYEIISLSEASWLVENNMPLTNKLVITFDDGFKENYSVIAPVLTDLKIPAVFFIITNCIDNMDLMWRNKLLLIEKYKKKNIVGHINDLARSYNLELPKRNENLMSWSFNEWPMELKEEIVNSLCSKVLPFSVMDYIKDKKPYCSAKEIRELSDNNFEIGTHSLSHPIMNKVNLSCFNNEILKSAKLISTIINDEVKFFSYPFGVRAKLSIENNFFNTENSIGTFLGIKNSLNNYGRNFKYWERDNLEFSKNTMIFRLLLLPIVRKLFNLK